MIKKIIGIIVCIIGLGVGTYLCYLHGTIYKDNQGLIACACFIGFFSAYNLIQILFKMLKK